MNNDYFTGDHLYYYKEGTDDENVNKEEFKEVFCVCYKVKSKLPGIDDKEMYSFTTKLDQAYKRFRIFPHRYATLLCIMTNDDKIIKLSEDGTTETLRDEDLPQEILDAVAELKIEDLYGKTITPYENIQKVKLERLETLGLDDLKDK